MVIVGREIGLGVFCGLAKYRQTDLLRQRGDCSATARSSALDYSLCRRPPRSPTLAARRLQHNTRFLFKLS